MRIVKEYLYEKFTEDSDPIKDLKIGPTIIDSINVFYSSHSLNNNVHQTDLDKNQIHKILSHPNAEYYDLFDLGWKNYIQNIYITDVDGNQYDHFEKIPTSIVAFDDEIYKIK